MGKPVRDHLGSYQRDPGGRGEKPKRGVSHEGRTSKKGLLGRVSCGIDRTTTFLT